MLIQRIKISNYKTYLSLDLDLTVDDDRPIILIGGANGGGKTTLFEASTAPSGAESSKRGCTSVFIYFNNAYFVTLILIFTDFFPDLTVIVTLPFFFAVITPLEFTVAIFLLEEL